jgi:hypothetical protein
VRNNLTAQLFLPAAVVAYLWACDSATPNRWRLRHAAAIIFVLLAILGKPVAVIVPVMLIAYEVCMERGGGRTLGGLPARTLGLTATLSYIGRRSLPDLSQLTDGGSTAQRLAHRTDARLYRRDAGRRERTADLAGFLAGRSLSLRVLLPPFVVQSLVYGTGAAWTVWAQTQVGAIKKGPPLLATLKWLSR